MLSRRLIEKGTIEKETDLFSTKPPTQLPLKPPPHQKLPLPPSLKLFQQRPPPPRVILRAVMRMQIQPRTPLLPRGLADVVDQPFGQALATGLRQYKYAGQPGAKLRPLRQVIACQAGAADGLAVLQGNAHQPVAVVLAGGKLGLPVGQGLLAEFVGELVVQPLGHPGAVLWMVAKPVDAEHGNSLQVEAIVR